MAELIDLVTFTDPRGNLTVIEKVLPFTIQRVFFIYGVDSSERGGHRHKTTVQAAICIKGSCRIYCNNGEKESYYHLTNPAKCVVLDPIDWHVMDQFTPDAILMIFASTYYFDQDYIFEPYHQTAYPFKQIAKL